VKICFDFARQSADTGDEGETLSATVRAAIVPPIGVNNTRNLAILVLPEPCPIYTGQNCAA
jgi:hypothetical protein